MKTAVTTIPAPRARHRAEVLDEIALRRDLAILDAARALGRTVPCGARCNGQHDLATAFAAASR